MGMSLQRAALTYLNESQCTGEIKTAHTAGQDTHSEVTMHRNAKKRRTGRGRTFLHTDVRSVHQNVAFGFAGCSY